MVDASPPPTILLLTRPGCHLCDDARDELSFVLAERGRTGLRVPGVREIDIETDAALLRRHLETIPVLVADGAELPLAMRPGAIRAFLASVLDAGPLPDAGSAAGSSVVASDVADA